MEAGFRSGIFSNFSSHFQLLPISSSCIPTLPTGIHRNSPRNPDWNTASLFRYSSGRFPSDPDGTVRNASEKALFPLGSGRFRGAKRSAWVNFIHFMEQINKFVNSILKTKWMKMICPELSYRKVAILEFLLWTDVSSKRLCELSLKRLLLFCWTYWDRVVYIFALVCTPFVRKTTFSATRKKN